MGFPTTSVLDSFGDTEGPPMTGWTTLTGASGLKSNGSTCLANAANAFGIWNSVLSSADCEGFVTVTTAAGSGATVAVYARMKDVSSAATIDGYGVVFSEAATDSWTITRYDNGAPTTLGAGFTQEVSNGDKIGIRCIGSSIQAWYCASGGSWTMLAERTDTTYAAAGYLALSLSDTTARVDDFGGGNYTAPSLNLAAGSYTVSGAAATLLRACVVNLAAGAYTLTGAAATVTRTRIMDLGAGSYTYTGVAATLFRGYTLTLGAGSYALTGQDAATTRTHIFNLAAGSYTLTGAPASTLAGRVLSLASGAYSLTGQPLTTLAARMLNLAAGSYTYTGAPASLLHNWVVTLTAGGYVLTGADATLTYTPVGAYTLNLEPGVYTLTGQAAALLAARTLNLGAGAYTLTGQSLTTLVARVLSLAAGSYSVTGTPSSLYHAYTVTLTAGGYTVTGADATLTVVLVQSVLAARSIDVTDTWPRVPGEVIDQTQPLTYARAQGNTAARTRARNPKRVRG